MLLKTLFSVAGISLLGFIPVHFQKQIHPIPEICDNAIDDDGDGLIDLNDPDCTCQVAEPKSLIPNPSFEEMDCCPSAPSQMDCATSWIQASEATTDFIHMCDFMGWDEFPPPLPFPDGEGCAGFRDGRVRGDAQNPEYNWKEYAGACLLSPLLKDTAYVFEFYVGFVDRFKSPPINITFFGTNDCSNLPFGIGDEAFGCPTNGPGWEWLGSTLVSGGVGNKWVKAKIEVTPKENINAIAIGPDCPPVQSPISLYYFFDDLTLADLHSFQFTITAQSQPCEDDFTLQIPDQPGFTYQWYKDGIALIGETSTHLNKMHGEGNYQVRIMQGTSCLLTGIRNYSVPVENNSVVTTICEGESYPFGDQLLSTSGHYLDTFKTIFNCDSIVDLNLEVLGIEADSVSVKIFEGETYKIGSDRLTKEGDYLTHLISSKGCDSLVYVQLTYYHVFIPNIFSPNGDGINDIFSVMSADDQIEKSTFSIFDRWGNQIFNGSEWDGRSREHFANPGVYPYIASIKMSDGIERRFSGSITLIR